MGAANKYLPAMKDFVAFYAAQTGGTSICATLKSGPALKNKIEGYKEELKKKDSAVDKELIDVLKMTADTSGHLKVKDLVRCSILYDTVESYTEGLLKAECTCVAWEEKVAGDHGAFKFKDQFANGLDVGFVALKNRWAKSRGYSDMLSNIKMQDKSKPNTCLKFHIGEIQFHVKAVIGAKEGKAVAALFGIDDSVFTSVGLPTIESEATTKGMTAIVVPAKGKMGRVTTKTLGPAYINEHDMYEVKRQLKADKSTSVYKKMLQLNAGMTDETAAKQAKLLGDAQFTLYSKVAAFLKCPEPLSEKDIWGKTATGTELDCKKLTTINLAMLQDKSMCEFGNTISQAVTSFRFKHAFKTGEKI